MRPLLNFFRIFLRILVLAVFVIGALLLGAHYLLQSNPKAIAQQITKLVQERTGYACDIKHIGIAIFPLPALGLTDVRIEGDDFSASVGYATLRPQVLPLLQGRIEPESITLLQPQFHWRIKHLPNFSQEGTTQKTATPPQKNDIAQAKISSPAPAHKSNSQASLEPKNFSPAEELQKWLSISFPSLPFSGRIRILRGYLEISDATRRLSIQGLESFLRLSPPQGIKGFIQVSSAYYYEDDEAKGGVDFLRLTCDGNVLGMTQGRSGLLKLDVQVNQFSFLKQLQTSIILAQNEEGNKTNRAIQITSQGFFVVEGKEIPFATNGTNRWENDTVFFDNWQLSLDRENAQLSAILKLNDPEPVLQGHITAEKFSLPQWFGFSRIMPGGLQSTLDAIRATLDFSLSMKNLKVTNIRASSLGYTFTGIGGVADWKKPVVFLDLRTPFVDLVKALPESLAMFPDGPDFSHPPLTPIPKRTSDPAKHKAPPLVGYDIRLGADRVQYARIEAQKVNVVIEPHSSGDTRLGFQLGGFYKGKGKGEVLLGSYKEHLAYTIEGSLTNVRGELVEKALKIPKLRLPKGNSSLSGKINAYGGTLDLFLKTMNGRVQANSPKGEIPNLGQGIQKATPYENLTLDVALARGNSYTKETLRLNGTWLLNGLIPTIEFGLKTTGELAFSEEGIVANALPSTLSVQGRGTMRTALQKTLVSGKASFSSGKDTLNIAEASMQTVGLTLKGNLDVQKVLSANPAYTGNLSVNCPNLRELFKNYAITLPPNLSPKHLKTLSGQATLKGSANEFTLSNIRTMLDAVALTGTISHVFAPSEWTYNLMANHFDYDSYFIPSTSATKHKSKEPWNLDFLKQKLVMSGTIHIASLRAAKCTFQKVNAKLSFKNNEFRADPVTFILYGAPATGNLILKAHEALDVQSAVTAKNFDLLSAGRDLKFPFEIGGSASLQSSIYATLASSADIPSRLNGLWSISIRNGYQQSRNAEGALTGKRTTFEVLRASGILERGVLSSKNLLLKSDAMDVTGSGWLNIDTKALDCKLQVSTGAVSQLPVAVSGTLDNPKTSIKTRDIIWGALGSFVGGIVNIFTSITGGALRTLR